MPFLTATLLGAALLGTGPVFPPADQTPETVESVSDEVELLAQETLDTEGEEIQPTLNEEPAPEGKQCVIPCGAMASMPASANGVEATEGDVVGTGGVWEESPVVTNEMRAAMSPGYCQNADYCESGETGHGWCPWGDDDDCEPCCWDRHLINYCIGPGDLHPHYPYCPVYHGYYYFRPYNFQHVFQDAQTAAQMGGDPRAPYSVEFLKPLFPPAPIEPLPMSPLSRALPNLEELLRPQIPVPAVPPGVGPGPIPVPEPKAGPQPGEELLPEPAPAEIPEEIN